MAAVPEFACEREVTMPPDASSGDPAPITPKQLREARTGLGWSPYRLAHVSCVTVSFIHEFEKTGRVAPLRWKSRDFDALASIRTALDAAGVEFTNGDPPSVKLAK